MHAHPVQGLASLRTLDYNITMTLRQLRQDTFIVAVRRRNMEDRWLRYMLMHLQEESHSCV